ncbi:hypothetical protein BAE44_0009473, partial [Dichanthelium oligosanthes]
RRADVQLPARHQQVVRRAGHGRIRGRRLRLRRAALPFPPEVREWGRGQGQDKGRGVVARDGAHGDVRGQGGAACAARRRLRGVAHGGWDRGSRILGHYYPSTNNGSDHAAFFVLNNSFHIRRQNDFRGELEVHIRSMPPDDSMLLSIALTPLTLSLIADLRL